MNSDAMLTRVVDGGYCIGCGACAAQPDAGVSIALDGRGMFQARVTHDGGAPEDFAAICPFSGESANEDAIAGQAYPDAPRHESIGRHLACYAGHVTEDDYRARGSSGGFVSWLLAQLLETGAIDGVIHVRADSDDLRFRYDISDDVATIAAHAKSRYYPVNMADVLARLRDTRGRYAIVGIPCFIKATRLLAAADPAIATRIAVRVAIVCGHLKSAHFADYLAMRCEVPPDQAEAIDFRHKLSDRHAGDYAVAVTPTGSVPVVKRMAEIYGGNWGYGFFKYRACDFCDDVVGETADISVGDAWLPGYIDDGMGANVVVVRNAALVTLVEKARRSGSLTFDVIDADKVARSQDAGLRDRREGLAWRLAEKDGAGQWRPRKRVEPSRSMPRRRQRIYALRQRISMMSHAAFTVALEARSLAAFDGALRPLTDAYEALYRPSAMEVALSFPRRVARKLFRIVTGR